MVVVGADKFNTHFLIYSWENPFNFQIDGAIDSNQVFLENSYHSSFPMSLLEVPHSLLGGRQSQYGIFSSLTYFEKIPITLRGIELQTRTGYF